MVAGESVAQSAHFTMYMRHVTLTLSNIPNLCPSQTDISTLHKQFLQSRRKIPHSPNGTILQQCEFVFYFYKIMNSVPKHTTHFIKKIFVTELKMDIQFLFMEYKCDLHLVPCLLSIKHSVSIMHTLASGSIFEYVYKRFVSLHHLLFI